MRALIVFLILAAFDPTPVLAQSDGIREVSATGRSLIPLDTKLRFTTMILLPDDEEILDVICGDKDFWVISAAQNIAHVKPAKEAATTNLNLVATSGTVYSFLLREGRNPQPDLKVYVNVADRSSAGSKPRYFTAAQVADIQKQLDEAKAAAERQAQQTNDVIASYRKQYPASLQFAYGAPKYQKPFYVRAIWHDGHFTYIKSDARELPALYEVKDGAPAIVNFTVDRGTYVVPQIIERGYLALGKQRFHFGIQGR